MTYDIESLCDDIKTILTTNLNTKLTAINNEKADSITLATIDASAYAFQSMNGATMNFDPFIFYGVQDIQGEGGYGQTPMQVEVAVILCLSDQGQDIDITKRVLRYGRALKEVFEEHFGDTENSAKLSVQSQVPIDIKLLNSSNPHRAIGVTLRADLG